MNYKEIIENIESRVGKRKSYDFSRMKELLNNLNNPQKDLKYFHIAGTNGKGSVSNFIYNMLMEEGYRVGLYTSPHLERYTERIIINKSEIPEEDFTRLALKVIEAERKIVDKFEMLTYFEFITAMGFLYFKENKCDYVVLEVGMGGLSDSTNVIDAKDKLASVITPISMDHNQFLGNTIEKIAYQKAGIIKENVPVITSNKNESVLKILEEKANENNTSLVKLKDDLLSDIKVDSNKSTYDISYLNTNLKNIIVNIVGFYQLENSALSVLTMLVLREKGKLNISNESIISGIAKTKWAGRMEVISKNPIIILDGAHNFDGINRLVENIKIFDYNKLFFITSILDDKEHEKMLKEVSKIASEIVLVNLHTSRKTDLSILENEAKKYLENVYVINDLESAIEKTLKKVNYDDLVIISGSLYLVSEVKELISSKRLKLSIN